MDTDTATPKISFLASYIQARYGTNPDALRSLLTTQSGDFQAQVIELGGLTYFAPVSSLADSYIAKNIRKPQRYLHIVSTLAGLSGPGVMLDIGSNIGLTSIPRAVLDLFTHVHAFEPEPRNFTCLQAAVHANNVGDRMTAWNLAVGERCSRGSLRLRSGMARHDMTHSDANDTIPCEVTSIDAWLDRVNLPATEVRFIKVDTQGFEVNVLRGATKILGLGKAVWQIEAAPALLRLFGVSQDSFVSVLKGHFNLYCDIENIRLGFRPIDELQPGLGLSDRNFTDLILFRR